MTIQKAAKAFGILILLVGILGFIPGVTNDGLLLGIFAVDTVHNIVHILTGIIAIYVANQGEGASRKFFQIFGIVYLLVTILGALNTNEPILGIMAHNHADLVLHIIIVLISLYYGFMYKRTM